MYYLSEERNPPTERFVDPLDQVYSTLPLYDERHFEDMAAIMSVEPVKEQDKLMKITEYRTRQALSARRKDQEGDAPGGNSRLPPENSTSWMFPPKCWSSSSGFSASITRTQTPSSTAKRTAPRRLSYDLDKMKKNADGGVTIYVGPKSPEGRESNWIPTAGKRPLPAMRFY
jgi:hypothetical protein